MKIISKVKGEGINKSKFLGYFKTVEEAHKEYISFKIYIIDTVISTLTDGRIINGLKSHQKKLMKDLTIYTLPKETK